MENETRLGRGMKRATKVLRILAKIVWICAFVASGFCLIGGISLAAVKDLTFTLQGETVTVIEYFEKVSEITYLEAIVTCFTSFIGLLASGIESIQIEAFFKAALREEGYFKPAVAKQCRNLGIFLLVAGVVAVILQGIAIGVGSIFGSFPTDGLAWAPGGTGIFFLLLCLFLYRGCELLEAKKEGDAQ